MCQAEARELERVLGPHLAGLNANMIAVSHQSIGLDDFQANYWHFETYLDPAKKFQKALGDRVAKKDDVHLPEVWAKGKAAYKALKSADPDYKVSADGEGSLLGGCFVFEAKTGIVGFMHCERVFGDVADPQALLGALTKARL